MLITIGSRSFALCARALFEKKQTVGAWSSREDGADTGRGRHESVVVVREAAGVGVARIGGFQLGGGR